MYYHYNQNKLEDFGWGIFRAFIPEGESFTVNTIIANESFLAVGSALPKYSSANYGEADTHVINVSWLKGGIGVISPGAILIAAFATNLEFLERVQKIITDTIFETLSPLGIGLHPTHINNDIIVDGRKLAGTTIAKHANGNYQFIMFINNESPDDLINKTSVKKRVGAGLLEFGINNESLLDKIEKRISSVWNIV